jgi:hypothetical protein
MWVAATGTSSSDAWILVTDDTTGQNRAAVATVRALARAGYRPAVSTAGVRSIAAASRFCEQRVLLPRAGAPGYAEALRAELASGRYAAALPASDVSLIAARCSGAELVNKVVAYERAQKADIPTLPWQVFESREALRACADQLPYPAVVKAVVKVFNADPQAHVVETPQDLDRLSGVGALIVQPYEDAPLRAVSGVVWDGCFLALAHQRYLRLWPVRAGVGSAAVTVAPDYELEEKLALVLEGHNGVFQAQLAGPYLLDLNPRVYGSLPLTLAAGPNLPAIACDAAQGKLRRLTRAQPGVRYRWVEGDVRHLVNNWKAGRISGAEALRAGWPHRRTAHSSESLIDPGPIVERLRYAALKRTQVQTNPRPGVPSQ